MLADRRGSGGPLLVVGIGSRRGVTRDEVRRALAVLPEGGARIYASVEAKAGEAGILAAIEPEPLHVRPATALAGLGLPGSARVESAASTPSVAEAAALLVAREHDPAARLVLSKTIVGSVTVAAALARPGS